MATEPGRAWYCCEKDAAHAPAVTSQFSIRTRGSLAACIYRAPVYSDRVMESPLREPTFLILTALAAGPQHGYGMIQDVRQISSDRVTLRAGTLYGVIDRLLGDGLVEVDHEEVVASRLRRYYRLTGAGAQLLSDEAERLTRHAHAAKTRLRRLRMAGGAA
jgi:DNA-binding PadR family transcriptional regulator